MNENNEKLNNPDADEAVQQGDVKKSTRDRWFKEIYEWTESAVMAVIVNMV